MPGGTTHPLTVDDIQALSRLRRTIEPDLARQSTGLLCELDLVRLEVQLRLLTEYETDTVEAIAVSRMFHLGLLRPAATNTELHVVRLLLHELGAHITAGMHIFDLRVTDLIDLPTCLSGMLRAFRYGNDQDRAEAATLNHINVVQELALRLV